MIKKIISSLSLVTALIVVFGIIKQLLFYNNFSLPIKYYLSISELGLLIAEDLLVFAYASVVYVLARYMLSDQISAYLQKVNSRKYKGIYYTVMLLLTVVFFILMLFANEYYIKIVLQAIVGSLFFFAFLDSVFAKKQFTQSQDLFLLLILLNCLIVFEVANVSSEIKSVVSGKYKGTIIHTQNNTFISTDSVYYIGQTDKYIFMSGKKNRITVIPLAEVKLIELKVNK